MKYKCLITDHDDTLLDSTVEIHYPCMLDCLEQLRPGTPLSFDEFAHYNFDLGFHAYATDILHLTPEEKEKQAAIWHEWVDSHHAAFFPHAAEVLTRYKKVVVAEQNMGQLAAYLRMKVDNFVPYQFNQVKGQPFVVEELVNAFEDILKK